MKIKLTSTDNDGIITTVDLDCDFSDHEDIQEFFEIIVKFCVKNGAEFPEEILEHLYDD